MMTTFGSDDCGIVPVKPTMLDDLLREILSSRVYDVAKETPLESAAKLTSRLGNIVSLKREDLQPIFSFKVRGACHHMRLLLSI